MLFFMQFTYGPNFTIKGPHLWNARFTSSFWPPLRRPELRPHRAPDLAHRAHHAAGEAGARGADPALRDGPPNAHAVHHLYPVPQ